MGNGIVYLMVKDEDGVERLVRKEYLDLTPKEVNEWEAQKMRSYRGVTETHGCPDTDPEEVYFGGGGDAGP